MGKKTVNFGNQQRMSFPGELVESQGSDVRRRIEGEGTDLQHADLYNLYAYRGRDFGELVHETCRAEKQKGRTCNHVNNFCTRK